MRLFCFGMGYVASYFAKALPWQNVVGTHRADFPLNYAMLESLRTATHILHSIPPTAEGDFVLNLQPHILNASWFGYLSTTGVYGNHNGGWVNENTPISPNNDRSIWRANAESAWLASTLPVNVFRLSGIYGAKRNVLEDLQSGTAKRIDKPNQYFSRIHVEDIVQILAKSLTIKGEVFNCADDLPCPQAQVVEYATQLLGISPPPLVKLEDANLSKMALSFYSSSRRVENSKIKQMLGVKLKYPTYKQGLNELFYKGK